MKRNGIQQRILAGLTDADGRSMGQQELAARLGVRKSEYGAFNRAVRQLHRDGRLVIGEDKAIHLTAPGGLIVGTFQGNPRGFGFVSPIDPRLTEDLYISPHATGGAVSGDLVEARAMRRNVRGEMRAYGRVVRIITRGKNRFVGTLTRTGSSWLVETDGKVIHQPIMVDDIGGKRARSGDRVVVRLTQYPQEDQPPRGVVLEILGAEGEYHAELAAVVRQFDLPEQFAAKTERDLDRVIEHFNRTTAAQLAAGKTPRGRTDLRDELIITIDPEDARDFDDAFSIKPLAGGWRLGVHIADVAAFVKTGAALDAEAQERGNSAYLPRKVLPMLPEALSNGLCSLQQDQDRLAKSVFVTYDRKGNVIESRFANSVIRSKSRLTYEQASAVLDGKPDRLPAKVIKLLKHAETLAKVIHHRREMQGMLHLALPEVELEYNDAGEVIDAHHADQSFSHTIIEMFMVEANEAVARLLDAYAIPFMRRIHPDPPDEAFEQLREFLTMFGYKVPKKPDRRQLQELLDAATGKPESFAVNLAVLRSLERAEYAVKGQGHYALASTHYCHFTSPIRRYPDLTIHRLLDDHLAGRLKRKVQKLRSQSDELHAVAQHCSFTDKRAENAGRQLTETLVLQLLSQHIGDHYDGVVSGVSTLGAFVQLQKFLIEGLIRVDEFGSDSWELNLDGGYFRGRQSAATVKIGDRLRVVVLAADPVRRHLDLAPADPSALMRPPKSAKHRKPKLKKRSSKKPRRTKTRK